MRRDRAEVLTALGLALGPVIALGFTRFAYALLLPAMRHQLSWSFAAAGGINTANALGYVVGCLSAAWWATRFGDRAVFAVTLAVSALMLVLSGTTGNYTALAVLRAAGGLATAINFVLGAALTTRISRTPSAMLVAIYMAGVGVGIALSGLLVPAALHLGNDRGWRLGWVLMGLVAAILAIAAVVAVQRVPRQPVRPADEGRLHWRPLAPTFGWYVLFGAGYVAYMTFIVALLADQGLGTGSTALFFVVLGVASAAGTLFLWGPLVSRLPRGRAPALVSGVVLLGVLPVLVANGLPAALISAVVFGSTFMAGPTAATVIAQRHLPAHQWTLGIALLTTAFSVGQAIGPLVAGALSDTAGGITLGLWLSVALLAASAVVALGQSDGGKHHHWSVADPARLAGGSAALCPLGLLALQQERRHPAEVLPCLDVPSPPKEFG